MVLKVISKKLVVQPDKERQLLPTRGQSPARSKKMGSSPKSDQVSYTILSGDTRPGPAEEPAHSREREKLPASKICFRTQGQPYLKSQIIIFLANCPDFPLETQEELFLLYVLKILINHLHKLARHAQKSYTLRWFPSMD